MDNNYKFSDEEFQIFKNTEVLNEYVLPVLFSRFTEEQMWHFVRNKTELVLKAIPNLLTEEQIKYCVKKEPVVTFGFAKDYLNSNQLVYCETKRDEWLRSVTANFTPIK